MHVSCLAINNSAIYVTCRFSRIFFIDHCWNRLCRYKDDSTTPIYSLDSRKTTLRNAHHAPAQWLSGRAYLQATSGTVSTPGARVDDDVSSQLRRGLPTNSQLTNRFGGTNNRSSNTDDDRTSGSAPGSSLESPAPSLLQLDPLEKEDEALYRCRVDFRRARTRNYEVQLIVVGKWVS